MVRQHDANSTPHLPERVLLTYWAATASRVNNGRIMFKPQFLAEFSVMGSWPAKAALIAAPVVVHPQIAGEHFPADPILPSFDRVYDAFCDSMSEVAPDQGLVLLTQLMSPAWLAKACSKDHEMKIASLLVEGHCREKEDPFFILESWISDGAIEESKGTLGFIVGAVYRQEEDPRQVVIPSAQAWESSRYRREVESALSVGPTLLRHEVLAPVAAEDALLNGFEGLCRMYTRFNDAAAHVDVDFRPDGCVQLDVRAGPSQMQIALDPAAMPAARVEALLRRLQPMQVPALPAPADDPRARTVH